MPRKALTPITKEEIEQVRELSRTYTPVEISDKTGIPYRRVIVIQRSRKNGIVNAVKSKKIRVIKNEVLSGFFDIDAYYRQNAY